MLAVEVRGEGDDHVTAGEHLAPGQVAVISQDLRHEPASLLERHRPVASSGDVDRGDQALDRPVGGCELVSPAAHELPLYLVFLGPPGGPSGDTSRPVGTLAAALALGLDLRRALRVQLQDLVGDSGDPPVPEPAGGTRIRFDPIAQRDRNSGPCEAPDHGGGMEVLAPQSRVRRLPPAPLVAHLDQVRQEHVIVGEGSPAREVA